MPYAAYTDIEARYPARDLVALTDPNNQSIQTGVIAQALADASVEIDSYLESRFTLPLVDPPAVLNLHCCTIAMYRLQSLRPLHDLEDARKRYDDVIKFLTKVADGTLTLGLSPDAQEPTEANPNVLVDSGGNAASDTCGPPVPPRVFSRQRLRSL